MIQEIAWTVLINCYQHGGTFVVIFDHFS